MTMRLEKMPYANARVILDEENSIIKLVSYTTTVIEMQDGILTIHGLYSATTRKHISAFMREYTKLSYYDAKRAYNENKRLILATGELV